MKLVANDLTFGYDSTRNVLDGLSLSYESPNVLCILGSNGMGKSTLLQCLIGEFKPSGGSVEVDGRPVGSYSARDLARKVAYIPQTHTPSFAYPVIDIVTMGRTSRMGYLSNPSDEDVDFAQQQLDYLGIGHLRDKPYTDISGGERQLVMIASALAQEPELLILDEPTAHLDFGNQYKFIQLVSKLRSKGMGVLMTTHFPDHALMLRCTTAILQNGRIDRIGPALQMVQSRPMTELYDIEVNVRQIESRTVCIPGPLT
jgi:iron complex transport system ATP-binding protein